MVFKSPYNLKNAKSKGVAIFHNIILNIHFYLSWFLFYVYYYFLILYINNDDKEQNLNDTNEKIKSIKIWINNKHFNIKIKLNNLFLLETNFEINRPYFYQFADLEKTIIHNEIIIEQKCLKFKEIFIEDFTNEFIYINLQHISIEDQFPYANDGYKYNSFLFFISLIVLISSIFPFKLHITNEVLYELVLFLDELGGFDGLIKPKFYNIYKIYGNFEEKVNYSRFICYIISTIILFILQIIRSVYGGFRNIKYIIVSLVINILIGILDLIHLILSILVIIFSILFKIANSEILPNDVMINIKIIFHIILIFIFILYLIFCFNLFYLFYSIFLCYNKR